MRIPAFEIKNSRGLDYASCGSVPKLMLIAGPNGAGKSTLLYNLRIIGGRNNILYMGPHRASRQQVVRQRSLVAALMSYTSFLSRDDTPTMEGVTLGGGGRNPWGHDDAGNYLKHSLCQIEIERKQAISDRYDRAGMIEKDSIPDPWQPLKDLTNNLLPHLEFLRIDNTNKDAIRCLWRSHKKGVEVDYDDLSSGEKSIIQMFYPLIEHRVREFICEIQGREDSSTAASVCLIIDEPELHLHPNLQIKIYDYFRLLVCDSDTQIILASHSPTIVEYATHEELFLLRPSELVESGDNQLIQIATDDDKLRVVRDLFGTTANITAMQPIIVVEGVQERGHSRTVSDRKLYRVLNKQFDRVTLIPGGGKEECRRLVVTLNEVLSSFSTKVKAVSLLDRDLDTTSSTGEYYLPVSMIENFILDSQPMWEALQSVIERTNFTSKVDIDSAIDKMLDEFEQSEVDRRIKSALGFRSFRPSPPFDNIGSQVKDFMEMIESVYGSDKIAASSLQAHSEVHDMHKNFLRRECFHGKDVVSRFHERYVHCTGMSKNVFLYEAMRHAASRRSVQKFFDELFATFVCAD